MKKKYFNISTEKPTPLSQYCDNEIIITKVSVVNGEARDLSNLIIITHIPQIEKEKPIQPYEYYSGNPSNETDEPMNVSIKNCKEKELIIKSNNGKKIEFRIQYSIVEKGN